MSRLDFRRSQHLSSLSPVSRWQRDHEGSRRNAIGKFRCGQLTIRSGSAKEEMRRERASPSINSRVVG